MEASRNFSGVLSQDSLRKLPCWTSREKAIIALNILLLRPEGRAIRRKKQISVKSCLAVARNDSLTADPATGRNVKTSHRTAARLTAKTQGHVRSERTVRKARDVMRLLGVQVVTEEGRYLTKTERLALSLQRDPNSRRPAQIRRASTRVFTMSKALVEKIGHLPRRGSTSVNLTSVSTNQERAKARRPRRQGVKWGLELQRLAGKLVNEATFLRAVRPGTICQALHRAGIDPEMWTAHDVATAMYADVTAKRWAAPAVMENPAGYLRFLLGTVDVAAHVGRKLKAAAEREARLASARAATRRAEAARMVPANERIG